MSYNKEKLAARIKEILYEYVAIQTDTGTASEGNITAFYEKWFAENEYLRERPGMRGIYGIPGDPHGRSCCWALLKGESSKTIVMLHHTDTVDTEDYLGLRDVALKPDELEAAFRRGEMKLDSQALEDLESGEWLFGRGVNDMKGGAAIHIALFEEYIIDPDFKGSLLLLAVPDEENLSAGMIGAAPLLNRLKESHGLDFVLCLCSEPSGTQVVIDGSIGKIMPMIYARGKLAHAAGVFGGLNPIRMMADVVNKLDLNPVFADKERNTTTAAPTFLYMKDRKNIYDVSLPMGACGYMTMNCMNKDPFELMTIVKGLCLEAFTETIGKIQQNFDAHMAFSGNESRKLPWQPRVSFYSEIYEEALRDSGADFEKALVKKKEELKKAVESGAKTLVQCSQELIELTLQYAKDLSPVIVVALAPPFYPNISNRLFGEGAAKVNEVISALSDFAKKNYGHEVKTRYMTGMCDLSYVMDVTHPDTVSYIEGNMLMWNNGYHIPFGEIKKFSMPVLNIGPEGRGGHMYTERVGKKSLYYDAPAFTDFVIRQLIDLS